MTIDTDMYYELLTTACNDRWKELASSTFKDVPDFIVKMFGDFLNNPLCVAITSILLVVAGFAVLRHIVASFRSTGL